MLAPGTLLQNRYLIVRLIAEGGMGAVYLARDQRLDSEVALKETLFTDERMSKAFEREARLLARLRHPALPRVSDHFIEENGQFLVMEYIPGEDLAEILKRRAAPFSYDDVIRWADQLLDALEYLHSQEPPIVHRDIKPQNLKLTERGQIILLDFGLAKGMPLHMSRVTSSGSIYGYTPSYAPMEQIQGAGTDPRSDLYSLGATLYHFVTGAVPIDALTRAAAVVEGQPDPLRASSEVNSQGPSAVAAVIQKALALSRNHRHASATEMRRAMRTALDFANEACDEQTAVIGAPKEVVIPLRRESEQPPATASTAAQVEELEDDETVLREQAAPRVRVHNLVSAGASAFDVGQYALAVEQWEAALELSPDELGVKESIDTARRALRKEEGRKARVGRLVAEGTEAFDAKRYEQAIEKWNQALTLSPNEPGVEASLKAARVAVEKEEERQAKVKQFVSNGTQAFDAGEYDLAIHSWKDALSLSPDETGIKKSIETASQKLRELLEHAKGNLQLSESKPQVEGRPPPTPLTQNAGKLSRLAQVTIGSIALLIVASVIFVFVLRTRPGEGSTGLTPTEEVGVTGQQAPTGPAQQVQQIIERAKNSPKDFQAQVEAAKVFNQIGRIAETADYLKRAYAIDAKKFNELGAAGFLGQYYFEQKNYSEAETWFNRAIENEPNVPDLHVALAETYVQREPPQTDQAIAQLQQALRLDPKSGHALGHLVEAYALKKDASAAEGTFNRLKKADPTNQRISALETVVADVKAGKAVSIPKE